MTNEVQTDKDTIMTCCVGDPEKIRPYREGVEAATTGKPVTFCPYAFDTSGGQQWLSGFRDGSCNK